MMILSAAKRPSSVARRMRLHRARKLAGLRCLTLEVRETEIAALVRKGLLRADSQTDDNAVRDAFYVLLDRSLTS
jgi:hypothetical protein